MNTDLIFHIGFPKCASTTLQNKVFANEEGYLGTQKNIPKNKDYAKRFQGFCPLGFQVSGSLSQAQKWAEDVLEEKNKINPNLQRMIVSSEMFANKNIQDNRPIIKFLDAFNKKVWTYGKVKVLFVMRNQAEKIASGYAQVSSNNLNASQIDFEKHIERIITKNKEHLEYYYWVKELYETFGKENVCVLFMEEIKQDTFWDHLNVFCELENFDKNAILNQANTYSKKIDKYKWLIRNFDIASKANGISTRFYSIFWPRYVMNSFRIKVVNFTTSVIKVFLKNPWVLHKIKVRGNDIVLSDNIQKKIKDAFKESNCKLSILLERDLNSMGY